MTTSYNDINNSLMQVPNQQPIPVQQPSIVNAPTASQVSGNISNNTPVNPISKKNPNLFNTEDFISDVIHNSRVKNKGYLENANNINGYDIAANCARQIVFKLLKYPIPDYKDVWLPVLLRAALGNAVHDFVQSNSTTFTEQECSIKIPSLNVSVRLDNLINNNVLVEIKSCTYSDYKKILNSTRPRDADFYQTIFYRYLLHNHLQEAQTQPSETLRSPAPALSKYNIDTIQYIYVAHDITAADSDSLSDNLKLIAALKKQLNSRNNKFFFINTVTIDINSIDVNMYESYIVEKLNTVNYFLTNQQIPPMDNKFVNKDCFFCKYKDLCKTM